MLVAALVACVPPAVLPSSSASPLLDAPAPAIESVALDGSRVSTAPGSVTVFEFFAHFCAPCQPRLDEAEQIHRELPDARFIGVSLDETAAQALSQVRRHAITFPVIHDPALAVASRFRVSELPSAVIVSRAGRVLWVGGPDQPQGNNVLREAVRAALALPPERDR